MVENLLSYNINMALIYLVIYNICLIPLKNSYHEIIHIHNFNHETFLIHTKLKR